MKIGLLSDPHLGFARYSKTNEKGVNQREADFYAAFVTGVENLCNAGVDAIVDLGDLADSPHPRKRAVQVLIDTINASGLPWWSANGNHTLTRRSGDIHLYEVLERWCPRFVGALEPHFVESLGGFLIPYGSPDEIRAGLEQAVSAGASWIGGHWACQDVLPQGHDISTSELPADVPVLLGHFHGRSYQALPCDCVNDGSYAHQHQELFLEPDRPSPYLPSPVYIGATERKAWGEASNKTGVAVLDVPAYGVQRITFIDHQARPYIDLNATHENYLDVLDVDLEGAMVRLTIDATPEQYRSLHEHEARKRASAALDFTMRRLTGTSEQRERAPATLSLVSAWREQVQGAQLPKGVHRELVREHGEDALAASGVAA